MDHAKYAPGEKLNFGAALKDGGIQAEPFDVTLRNVSRVVKTGKKETLGLLDDVSLYFKVCSIEVKIPFPFLRSSSQGLWLWFLELRDVERQHYLRYGISKKHIWVNVSFNPALGSCKPRGQEKEDTNRTSSL